MGAFYGLLKDDGHIKDNYCLNYLYGDISREPRGAFET